MAALTWSVSPKAPIWTSCGPNGAGGDGACRTGGRVERRDLDLARRLRHGDIGAGAAASTGGGRGRGSGATVGAGRRAAGIVGQSQKLHPHRRQALVLVAELAGGGLGQVDQAVADERAAIVDPDLEAAAVLQIGDAHDAGQRQVGCAALICSLSNTSPLAVGRPWKSAPYQEAVPTLE